MMTTFMEFTSPVDLSNPGIELGSPALQADSLPTELSEKPYRTHSLLKKSEKLKKVSLNYIFRLTFHLLVPRNFDSKSKFD